ncbi:MAG: biopolymer transporter ExbD [Planctomycetales bacterium]|nr:biopolymer transporter ExbD [Planctomycetales bacterium]
MLRDGRLNKLLVEPAAVATGDIAFNLIIFFLVCASVQPDSGKRQDLPRSEPTKQQEEKTQNIELALSRTKQVVSVNGDPVKIDELPARLRRLLEGKRRPEDRVVVVKSKPDVPYDHWIAVTTLVQDLGASITIQREEERTVTVGD